MSFERRSPKLKRSANVNTVNAKSKSFLLALLAATISDGKLSEFGFISHTIDCPGLF